MINVPGLCNCCWSTERKGAGLGKGQLSNDGSDLPNAYEKNKM